MNGRMGGIEGEFTESAQHSLRTNGIFANFVFKILPNALFFAGNYIKDLLFVMHCRIIK